MKNGIQSLSQEEIFTLSARGVTGLFEELRDAQIEINRMVEHVVENLLYPLMRDYNLQSIGIDPHYDYSDEGFEGTYMISIDGEDVSDNEEDVPKRRSRAKNISYANLQRDIDDMLTPYRAVINQEIGINCTEILDKLSKAKSFGKLHSNLPVNERKPNRFKV